MLTLIVPQYEIWDSETRKFSYLDEITIQMEHSLVTLSKWESIYEKPFLSKDEKTTEEILTYLKIMIQTDIEIDVATRFSEENYREIREYMNSKQSATWFHETKSRANSGEIITAELIYYWMNVYHIPTEYETWHLNRLFTLIRIHNLKSQKPQKMSQAEIFARNRELNARRRAQLGTKG